MLNPEEKIRVDASRDKRTPHHTRNMLYFGKNVADAEVQFWAPSNTLPCHPETKYIVKSIWSRSGGRWKAIEARALKTWKAFKHSTDGSTKISIMAVDNLSDEEKLVAEFHRISGIKQDPSINSMLDKTRNLVNRMNRGEIDPNEVMQ